MKTQKLMIPISVDLMKAVMGEEEDELVEEDVPRQRVKLNCLNQPNKLVKREIKTKYLQSNLYRFE
jgi:hypothetical protein